MTQKKQPDFLDLAKTRKTTYEFSEKPVDEKDIEKILEAARWAPSSHNSQPWSFILIKNKKTIEKILDSCYYGFFRNSPSLMVAIVMEPIYVNENALLRGNLKKFADTHKYMNMAFPVSNMLHEATSLGISSGVVSPIAKEVNNVLKVPSEKEVPLIICLGYEKKNAYHKKRQRKKLDNIVYYEVYKKG